VQYKKQSAADWTLLAAEPYTVAVEDEDIRIRVVFEQDQSLITTRIDDAHFPDNALRTLVKQFDTNADGSLGKEEKAAVRQLDCSNRGITSLKGIELFRELEVLNASNNSLTTVDLSRNRALTDIILAGNVSLTGITFPEGITAISNNAFKGCTALKAMDIPTTVTGIGESAFEGCTGLASVTLSDDVSTIGRAAFKNCSSLSSMSIAGAA
ncbi:MAG: leucine-rich repeat protein, partial [Oscillospiraceae bacterium]|nr:leucine-rich repeat protein [Oscillospiraceae bacterium]